MRQLIQRWLGGSRPSAWDLSDYPAFPLPHPGFARALSPAQAAENLAAFTSSLDARQRALRGWLLAHGGPDATALRGAVYATALKRWALTQWQHLPPFGRLPTHSLWPDCPRDGAFIVYSLLGDLAASLGEAIRHANGDWRWGLNLDPTDLADGMATSRRVVLLADLAEPTPETCEAVLDLEALVFSAYRFPQSVDFVHLDTWTGTARDAIDGAHYR